MTHRLQQLDDENFKQQQDKARKSHRILPAFAKGYLLTDPDDVPRLAEKFIGRETFKTQMNALLQQNETLLLHGVGGVGKSAFASELTADKLENDNQPILWVEVGNAPVENVFSVIGQAFGQQQAMAVAKTDEDKIKLTRDLIKAHQVAWLVIDDAWNPAALTSLLKTISRRNPIPVLITSRQRHIITGEMHAVDSLLPDDALTLLTFHMANNTQHDGVDDLCKAVGYHPFMLEIAGKLLQQRDISPKRLLDDMDKTELLNISLGEGVAEVGRENMAKLLLQSLNALPDDLTRAVFLAFGAFPTPIVSPEMLALYLSEGLVGKRHASSLSNLTEIQTALNVLHQHGLVRRLPAETRGGYPYSIETYRVHDLAHAYGGGQNPDLPRMVSACLAYTWRHNQPNYDNFSALRPELENLVGASGQAMTQERWQDVEDFAWNLFPIGGSRFTNLQGYYTDGQTLLSQAAQAAEKRGDKQAQGGHLSNLGLAYSSLGDYQTAIDYHKQALVVNRAVGRKIAEGANLGNLGIAYRNLGDYQTAIDYCQQQLEIVDEIGDKKGKGNALGGLGIAYDSLEEREQALDYYQQALAVAREIGDRNGVAMWLYNTGSLMNDLGRYAEAIPMLEESVALVKTMEQQHKIANRERELERAQKGLAS